VSLLTNHPPLFYHGVYVKSFLFLVSLLLASCAYEYKQSWEYEWERETTQVICGHRGGVSVYHYNFDRVVAVECENGHFQRLPKRALPK
jgi:hypothetical protein